MAPATNCLRRPAGLRRPPVGVAPSDGMATVRVADVLRVENLGEAVLGGSPRRPCLRPTSAKIKSLVRGEHDDGHGAYLRGAMKQYRGARMVGRFQPLGSMSLFVALMYFAHCAGVSELFRNSEQVNQHQAGHLIGISTGKEPGNQTTPGVSDKNVWPRFLAAVSRACRSATPCCAVVGCSSGWNRSVCYGSG